MLNQIFLNTLTNLLTARLVLNVINIFKNTAFKNKRILWRVTVEACSWNSKFRVYNISKILCSDKSLYRRTCESSCEKMASNANIFGAATPTFLSSGGAAAPVAFSQRLTCFLRLSSENVWVPLVKGPSPDAPTRSITFTWNKHCGYRISRYYCDLVYKAVGPWFVSWYGHLLVSWSQIFIPEFWMSSICLHTYI